MDSPRPGPLRAGKLRTPVTIQVNAAAGTQDSRGQEIETWQTYHQGWAQVEPVWLGSKEINAAATIQAVRFHHHPGSATINTRLVAAVQVADIFVRRAAIGNSGNPEEVTTEAWVAADGWNLLFPGATEEQTFARANMERSLERLSTILEGLI